MSRVHQRRLTPPGLGPLVVILLAFLALAWWLGRQTALDRVHEILGGRAVSERAFGSAGTLKRVLGRLDAIHPAPPALAPSARGFELDELVFGLPAVYALERIPRERVAEALRIDRIWLGRPVAVVSLLMRPSDLGELVANPTARGRDWERRGYLGYVENGEHRFGSFVGVRLHGGWTRRAPPERRSYRIYLRNRLGRDRFTVPLFPGREEDPPSELVIRNDGQRLGDGKSWYFRSPLAYDIARRVGVPAPHTRHALLFVNGQPMGIRALTEFIQRDFLRARFGIEQPVLVRTKSGPWDTHSRIREGDPAIFRRLTGEARSGVDVDWIRANIDVDNLYRWFLAVLFCHTTDPFQGTLVYPGDAAGGRWFWIAWDLDGSFQSPGEPEAWRHYSRLTGSRDLRSKLLRRLLADERERRVLLQLAHHELDHGLTDEFLDERWRYYRDLAATYGLAEETRQSLAEIRRFLLGRRETLSRLLIARLGGEPDPDGAPPGGGVSDGPGRAARPRPGRR